MSEYARRIEGAITEVVHPIASRHDVELLDIRFVPQLRRSLLRVTIDMPVEDGPQARVTVDQCAGVSRDLAHAIEAEELIDESYLLEVSSPGIDRPLRSERDFKRNLGQKVVVHFQNRESDDDKIVQREGTIGGFESACLVLQQHDELLRIPIDAITSAKLDISF